MATSVTPEVTQHIPATDAPPAPAAPASSEPASLDASWDVFESKPQSPRDIFAGEKPDPKPGEGIGDDPLEGDAPAAPTDAVAVADPATAADAALDAEPDVTPIPFKYTADGREIVFDGIHEVPGEGLLVDEAVVPRVRDMFQRVDHLTRQYGQLSQEQQRFEKIGGWKRVEELEANSAVLNDVGKLFLEIVTDQTQDERGLPAKLAQLAENPEARRLLIERLDVMTQRASMTARSKFNEQVQNFGREAAQGTDQAQSLSSAIDRMGDALQQAGMPVTAEDLAEARDVFGPFMQSLHRPATAEEAAALGVAPGTTIFDFPKLHPWFTARAQFRQRESASQSAQAAASAENKTRLAPTTPTRPVKTSATSSRPGPGKQPSATRPPARPQVMGWKQRMMLGLSPDPDDPATANP